MDFVRGVKGISLQCRIQFPGLEANMFGAHNLPGLPPPLPLLAPSPLYGHFYCSSCPISLLKQWRCSQQYVKINYSFAISDTGNNNFYKVFLVVVVIVVMVVMMVVVN